MGTSNQSSNEQIVYIPPAHTQKTNALDHSSVTGTCNSSASSLPNRHTFIQLLCLLVLVAPMTLLHKARAWIFPVRYALEERKLHGPSHLARLTSLSSTTGCIIRHSETYVYLCNISFFIQIQLFTYIYIYFTQCVTSAASACPPNILVLQYLQFQLQKFKFPHYSNFNYIKAVSEHTAQSFE